MPRRQVDVVDPFDLREEDDVDVATLSGAAGTGR
jgi:hypothetical protein